MILVLGERKVRLELLPVSTLKPHEETVGRLSEGLVARIIRDGLQRDPIIVDEQSGVVLDGMHRLEVLRKIGAKNAVCYVIDYKSSDMKLYRWLRAVKAPSPALLQRLLKELELTPDNTVGLEGSPKVGIWIRGEKFGTTKGVGFEELCAAMRRFDKIVSEGNARVEFMDEETLKLDADEIDSAVLLTPRIIKSQVLFAGRTGALLPPKSTLHVFPLRPVNVNYPLEYLKSGRDELEGVLATKAWKRVEPPAFHEGRMYREELLVFE
jgi:hypothetical protein